MKTEELQNRFDIAKKQDSGEELNPIERFIYENDPASIMRSEKFTSGFIQSLNYHALRIASEAVGRWIELRQIIDDCPELNMGNYSEDQVEELNNAMIQIAEIVNSNPTHRAMRQIKFRGKRIDNGEWVYGYLVEIQEGRFAIKDTTYHVNDGTVNLIPEEVDPETVGQFTVLLDKNGVEIYEGDRVKCSIGVIIITYPFLELWDKKNYGEAFEVIGNIHETGEPK